MDDFLILSLGAPTVVTLGILWAVACLAPKMGRRTIFFAVTVSPGFRDTPEAAAISARYRKTMHLHSIGAALFTIVCMVSPLWTKLLVEHIGWAIFFMTVAPVVWQVAAMLLAFVHGRNTAMQYSVQPTTVREAVIRHVEPNRHHATILALLLVAPMVVIAISAAYLWMRWDDIPQTFASHWNARGKVDGWMNKSVSGVFGPFALSLPGYIICVAVAFIIPHSRRLKHKGIAGKKEQKFRLRSQIAILGFGFCIVSFTTAIAVWIPLRDSQNSPTSMIVTAIVIPLVLTVAFVWYFIRMGQGGEHIKLPESEQLDDDKTNTDEIIGDGTLDHHWKAGLFYYNPDDPAVWVDKRFGIGWTPNFARPVSWVILSTILIVPMMFVALTAFLDSESQAPCPKTLEAQTPLANFVTDPELIGSWRSVDFVKEIDDFDLAQQNWKGELYLQGFDVLDNGLVQGTGWIWTKGFLMKSPDDKYPAAYAIKEFDGKKYLFLQWMSGDVTIRGMKPKYYVMKKVVGETEIDN